MSAVLGHWFDALRFRSAVFFLTVVATAGCARTSTLSAVNQPPFFTLRVAFNDSTAGRERVQHDNRGYFLAPEVLLSDADVLSVSSVMRPEVGLLLNFQFRTESGRRLSVATAKHVGNHIAVLLDSRVWNVASIANPIGSGVASITIATGATGQDAKRIARQIRSRWP